MDPFIRSEYGNRVGAQVASGFLGPGAATRDFCEKLAEWLGAPRLLATVSGTVALTVAAKALGLKSGDEVIVPGYGVISTVNGLVAAGLEPRLADIDRTTGCVSPQTLDRRVTSATKAVCFVNFSGYTGANVREVRRWCDAHRIAMIEDAACALGHRHDGMPAGCFGTIGCYSFSVPKVLTTGQGGALTSGDPDLFDRAGAYIDQGDLEWRRTGVNRSPGSNLRFNDVLASLGSAMLSDIDIRQERRRASYRAMKHLLGDKLYAVPGPEAPLHNIVFTDRPHQLVEKLKKQNISAQLQYKVLSEHPAYARLASDHCPNGEYWSKKAVYLPFGVGLTVEQAERVAASVTASGIDLLPVQ